MGSGRLWPARPRLVTHEGAHAAEGRRVERSRREVALLWHVRGAPPCCSLSFRAPQLLTRTHLLSRLVSRLRYHTLALTEAGDTFSFGFGGSFLNGAGGLGHGDRTTLETPTKLDSFTAAAVSAGGYHSVAVDASGSVWSWGRGEWGRLGHNESSDCYEPTLLESVDIGEVASVLAGDVHTGALTTGGAVYTWGRNENWQLGYEVTGLLNAGQSLDAQQEPQIVEIPSEATVTKLSCGELGTAALLSDGTIYVWGMGRFFEPTKLPGVVESVDGTVVDLQVGAYHLALLTDAGGVYTFGTGPSLGLPRTARRQWELAPLEVEGRVVSMSCGPYTTALVVA